MVQAFRKILTFGLITGGLVIALDKMVTLPLDWVTMSEAVRDMYDACLSDLKNRDETAGKRVASNEYWTCDRFDRPCVTISSAPAAVSSASDSFWKPLMMPGPPVRGPEALLRKAA